MAATCILKCFRPRSYSEKCVSTEVDKLVNCCQLTIRKSAEILKQTDTTDNYFRLNSHQCDLLLNKLSEIGQALAYRQPLLLLEGKTIPVLEELLLVLVDAETVIQCSIVCSSEWLRAAIEQRNMEETFQKLLYEVQWHVDLLQSILVDDCGESRVTFVRTSCSCQLTPKDKLDLLEAVERDEAKLQDHLSSNLEKLDDPTGKSLAMQLLKSMKDAEDQLSSRSIEGSNDQQINNLGATEDQSTTVVGMESNDHASLRSSFELMFLDPKSLDTSGTQLGKGTFACVRRIPLLGTTYAAKIFDLHSSYSFDRELAAIRALGHHPHIVRLVCYSKNESECSLVMEEMHKDLKTFLNERRKKRSPLSNEEAVDLMLQIGEGVKYMHNRDMVHRDLKSGNILVNQAGSAKPFKNSRALSSVKIADFGLTKIKDASRTATQTMNTGTSQWMAPEVRRMKEENVSGIATPNHTRATFNPRKADVYSFAIVCSEILTLQLPYSSEQDHIGELKKQVKAKADPKRPNLPKDCPPRLASLIRRCWAGSYVDRPLFPEICAELRYIKGLLLRGDQKILQTEPLMLGFESNVEHHKQREWGDEGKIAHITASVNCIKKQGPWGRDIQDSTTVRFSNMAKSIKWIQWRYMENPAKIVRLEVGYVNPDDTECVGCYCENLDLDEGTTRKVDFGPGEFMKQISG